MEKGNLIKDNIIQDKGFKFAVNIVRLYQFLSNEKKEFVLAKQILKSGTSIGANICEAQQGQSKKDFLMKMNISLKECSETKYWINLLNATDYIDDDRRKSLMSDCIEIEKILTKIVKTTSESIK